MSARKRLSVVMIAKNEASLLADCLASVAWADEIVVLDSGSEDETIALAQQYGAKVYSNTQWPGYGKQRQLAQQYATGEYILMLDADERVTPELKTAIEAAYREGETKLKGNGKTVPALSALKTPLRDGDTERPDDEAYAGSYFINANSATAPGIVDSACETILERSQLYSGVYARASVNFFAFNSNGNKGIACGLNNIQKLRDGDPLGGKSRAEDDFATDDDDDFLS